MLSDLTTIDVQTFTESDFNDYRLPDSLKVDLQNLLAGKHYHFGSYTSYACTSVKEHNFAVFPNQYLLFVAQLSPLLIELKKYFDLFDSMRRSADQLLGTSKEIFSNIKNSPELKESFESEEDIHLYARFLDKSDSSYRRKGKRFVDDAGVPRGNEDLFSSVVLAGVNLPNASSAIFGALAYWITEQPNILKKLVIESHRVNASHKSNKEKYEKWCEQQKLSVPHNYVSYIDSFWGAFEAAVKKHADTYHHIYKDNPEIITLNREVPLYDYDLEKLMVLSSYSKLLNLRDGKSQGDSGQSAGLSRLISWKKSLKTDIGGTQNYLDREQVSLPKPFVLLAGISGTGKSRFVREQSLKTDSSLNNFCLTPVRPDWHEPSDLLGYVSRLGTKGAEFISTDVLNFIIKSWKAINPTPSELESGKFSNKEVAPFWLCLDEMNLAPVEQYFSDYLAILETRKWDSGVYSCDALLKPEVITLLPAENQSTLRNDWSLQESEFDGLWAYFLKYGIPIPFNLIVAGTVNMDETTHGFSRKVIDRALTFDFGQFFPNEFNDFFTATKQAKIFGYPLYTQAKLEDFSNIVCDNDAQKTITFIQDLNSVLKNTLFELAYRALNELLLSVISFQPKTEQELLAVWDDFLMCKVLPRIEGDEDKLKSKGKSLLTELSSLLNQDHLLKPIWDSERPDLLREAIEISQNPVLIECRSRNKIKWMNLRLDQNGFTSFWP